MKEKRTQLNKIDKKLMNFALKFLRLEVQLELHQQNPKNVVASDWHVR